MTEEIVIDQVVGNMPVEETEQKEKTGPFGIYTPKTSKLLGYKILLYGGPGTGKTWAASTFKNPLFLDLEGGLQPIAFRHPLRYPKNPKQTVMTVEQIYEFYKMTKAELAKPDCPFSSVIIDSINEMQSIVMQNVISSYSNTRQMGDTPTMQDYGKSNRDMLKLFRLFLRLPCNVIFTAVSSPRAYEDEQVFPRLVGKEVLPEVMRLISAIGYHYTVMDGDEVKYMVSFASTPAWVAKDRLGIGQKPISNNFGFLFSGKDK